MTGKQSAVLWSGILLIILRLASTGQWSVLWGTVSTKQSSAPKGSANPSSGSKAPNSQTLSV